MTESIGTLPALIGQYTDLTEALSQQTPLEPRRVLACLVLRDQIAHHLSTQTLTDAALIPALAEADKVLQTLFTPISHLPDLPVWRETLDPPETAWWWHFKPPEHEKLLGLFERYDWIWDTLNIVVLTIILALLVDVAPRFYRGGTDTAGAFAIVIQSVLTMITAGGILTKTGSQALERAFKGLHIPPILWQEIRLGLAVISLVLLLLFRNAGLPFLARVVYHEPGQQLYEAGKLLEAQHNYQRALELNPNTADSTIMQIHYDLGRLFEDLQEFGKAKAAYQIAVQGNYIPAYNNLARLKILVDKRYDEAVFLLLNGLKLAKEEEALQGSLVVQNGGIEDLLYEMQKNLGWARLKQARFREAKAELELAGELKPDEASAYCLLAQVIDGLDQENGLENSLEAQAEWERCGQLANRLSPDEDGWIYQARLAQLRPPPGSITDTTTLISDETDETGANVANEALLIDGAPEVGFHLLIAATDQVLLKRLGWSDYFTTTVGVKLQRGDQLWLTDDAQALVLCDDLTTWSLPSGVALGLSNGCASSETPILQHQVFTVPTKLLEMNDQIPYIISPRATQILTKTPTLRWNRIPGAVTYTVQLLGGDTDWSMVATQPGIVYTGDVALEPGITYTLRIQASDGSISNPPDPNKIGFSLLPIETVLQVETQLAALGLTGSAEALARVELYIAHNLTSDAIEALLPLVTGEHSSSAIHHQLGDLYHRLGLVLLAETYYQRAFILAERENNLAGQAQAQAALAQVFLLLNKDFSARHWFREARASYQALGDRRLTEAMSAQIAALDE